MAALFFFGYHEPTLYLRTHSMKKTPLVVRKAVLPVAGLGTRMLPATKAIPKEMLPVVDKPAIQYVMEEAVRAGVENVVMVTGRNKGALEDHFDRHWELEKALEKKGDDLRLRRSSVFRLDASGWLIHAEDGIARTAA